MRRLFIILLISVELIASGQSDWDLKSCIDYAIEHKIEVLQQAEVNQLSEKQLKYSKFNLLPSLEFDATRDIKSYRTFDQISDKWEHAEPNVTYVGLITKLGLFNSLYNLNNIQMYRYLNLKSKNKLDQVKNEIVLSVLAAYTNCLYYQESYKISLKQQTLIEKQKEDCEILLSKGKKSELDLLEIKARILDENIKVTEASKKLNESIINLKKAIEFPDTEMLSLSKISLPQEINYAIPSSDSIYYCAIRQLPDFDQFDNQIKASDCLIKSMKSQYYPKLYLTGSISSEINSIAVDPSNSQGGYSFSRQYKDNLISDIGLQLTVPIYSKHEIKQKVIIEQSNLKELQFQKQKALNDIYFEIELIDNNVQTYSKNFEALLQSVKSYTEIFDLTDKLYNHGVITFLEYITAKNNLEESEFELIKNKYNLLYFLKLVDFYLGKPLTL
jgi:outer membrane protein